MMEDSTNNQNRRKNGGGNWIGILIFLLIVGSQFFPSIIQNITQIFGQSAGMQIGTSLTALLPYIIAGVVILSIVWSVLSNITRSTGSGTSMPRTTLERPGSLSSSPYERSRPLSSSTTGHVNLPTTSWKSGGQGSPFPPGVHLGQSRPEAATAAYSQLPRGINMEIPRSINMERLSASIRHGNPYKTPGFEPMVDPKLIVFGVLGLMLIVGGLMFGVWISSVLP